MLTKKEKIGIFSTIIVVILIIIFSIIGFNHVINTYEQKINEQPIIDTYAQAQEKEYEQEKHKPKATIKEIAYTQMEEATGLSGTGANHFQNWGINTDDKFIKYGILSGDGIPYYSTMKNSDSTGQTLKNFDAQNDSYWKQIKDKDFNNIKDKVNKQLPQLTSKNNQINEIKDNVQKAEQDDIMNHQKIKEEHYKTMKPTDVQ